jgi:hypothetical protein
VPELACLVVGGEVFRRRLLTIGWEFRIGTSLAKL